jgi:hypothetical protein
MTRLTLVALLSGFVMAMTLTASGGPASSAPAAIASAAAMSPVPAGVTITPAGYHRPYYGPRYRYPRYGYPHYYRGYYYPRIWWGAPGPVYMPPPGYGGYCARWSNRCASRWGYRNRDYRGCMRYHGC